MELLKYLLHNYDIDDMPDTDVLWHELMTKFDRDDMIECANALVFVENLPKALLKKIWEQV